MLPRNLAVLVRRQAFELSVSRFDDVTRLRKVLDQTLAEAPTRPIRMTPPQRQGPAQTARAGRAAAAAAAAGLSHGSTAAASGNRHAAARLLHGPHAPA